MPEGYERVSQQQNSYELPAQRLVHTTDIHVAVAVVVALLVLVFMPLPMAAVLLPVDMAVDHTQAWYQRPYGDADVR